VVSDALKKLYDLSDRVAIVTGASSGLGVVFAKGLAEAGANVVIAARREEKLRSVAKEISALGVSCLPIPTDVTDEARVDYMVSQTLKEFGKVDILVNNAGVTNVIPVEELPLAAFRRVVDRSLIGSFLCSQRVGREMLKRGYGRIINIASAMGVVGSGPEIPLVPYVAAKHGLIGLTKEFAVQWAKRGVTVNAIGPAWFPSEMTEKLFEIEEKYNYLLARTPMGRVGQHEDLKGPVVFLASEASSYITGQTLFVDGGWTAW